MPVADLAGRRFGSLLVTQQDGLIGTRGAWLCLCDCGRTDRYASDRLTRPETHQTAVRACRHCRAGLATVGRFMDLTGQRYGALTVEAVIGRRTYGGRMRPLWRCKCDCGETIELISDHLPHAPGPINAAARSGRRLYTECETCRQKSCAICGARYSYSHPSHICPSPACQLAAQRERDAYWHAVAAIQQRNDPQAADRRRQHTRAWYERNREAVAERRAARLAADPALREARRSANAEWYAALRADAERYARRMQGIYAWRARRALADLTHTGAALAERLEDSTDD